MKMRTSGCSLAIVIPGLAAGGCAMVGEAALRGGRAAYNEAIVATDSQQLLTMIVRMRYNEPVGLLAVTSITANVSLSFNAAAQVGVGAASAYEGNLVPFGAGVVYEENPTISYLPVQGEKYLRPLLSPVPLDLAVLLLSASRDSPQVFTLLIRTLNDIRNMDFRWDPEAKPDPRFARIAELLSLLDRAGYLTWGQEPGQAAGFAIVLNGEGPEFARPVDELFTLLGLEPPKDHDPVITLPVSMGVGIRTGTAIQVTTRSIYDLFEIAAASVDVPEEDVQSGLAPPLPLVSTDQRLIRVNRSKDRPKLAMVAVQRDGWWYSIDGTDLESKETFRIMQSLLSVRLADSIERSAAPVLTVPVSK